MNAIKCNRLDDIKAATVEYKVIAIDEGQFVSSIFIITASQKYFSFLTLLNFVKILLITERLLLLLG